MTDRHLPGNANLTYFTVTCHLAPIIADLSQDSDYNPNTTRIDAVVTFTPKLRSGEVIHAHTALPPTGFLPLPVTAMIDDGYLKLRSKPDLGAAPLPGTLHGLRAKLAADGNTAMAAELDADVRALNYAPVRLLGNSTSLELDPEAPLFYDFQFSSIKIDGKTTNISITGGTFEAPWEDTVVDLLDWMPLTPGPYAQPMVVGPPGPQGPPGDPGPATVDAGATTTTDPGTDAVVTNVGDTVNAVFEFQIPRGEPGPPGPPAVAEVSTVADLPAAGDTSLVYLVSDTGDLYRWTGAKATGYQRVSEHVHSTGIEDSTQVGRDVVTAADAPAARSAIEASQLRVDGVMADVFDFDSTPPTAADVGAYSKAETDSLMSAALVQPTVVKPRLNDGVYDKNGAAALLLVPTAGAVNYLTLTNRTAGVAPGISAAGQDANIGIILGPKGTGVVQVYTGTGITPAISAAGPEADKGLNLMTKGTGKLQWNGNTLVTETVATTLTNKNIDYLQNIITNLPYDVTMMPFGVTVPVAAGLGDSVIGRKMQRSVTFKKITFRCAVAGTTDLVVELRKNNKNAAGVIAGTSTTIPAASQATGVTITGSWAFNETDLLYVSVTSPGGATGLIVELKGSTTLPATLKLPEDHPDA